MLNCVLIDHDGESSAVLENVARSTGQMTVVKSCKTMTEAIDVASTNKIDLFFLDLLIPGFSKSVYSSILKNETSHTIAFADDKEAAVDAYDLGADDFILKPLKQDKLLSAIKKVYQNSAQYVQDKPNDCLFVKVNSRLERVDMKSIFEVEAMADYVNIYTRERRYTVHSTMKGIESRLPQNDFSRVHKSFIVRLDRITEINGDSLIVEKNLVPVSMTYKKQLLDRLNIV